MGRTKGSLNKKTIADRNISSQKIKTPIIVEKALPDDWCKKKVIPVKEIKDWLESKTVNNTPIRILGIVKCANEHFLWVQPWPETKSYKTTIQSTSVIKPKFPNLEVENEFVNVKFA